MKIEAVILYSSNDFRFFKPCIQNLLDLNIKCHIITYTHMWNGTEENLKLLEESNQLFQNNNLYNQYNIEWQPGQSPWYWEALGRYLATKEVSENADYILYIDVDEIIDSNKFKNWLDSNELSIHSSMKLADYWYWREPIYRAKTIQYNTVITKTSLAKSLPFIPGGREPYFQCGTKGYSNINLPFIHHFSWVRTKKEMINKVKNWGHAFDKDNWILLIEEEFSRDFNGKDFLHNPSYEYEIVKNKFNI